MRKYIVLFSFTMVMTIPQIFGQCDSSATIPPLTDSEMYSYTQEAPENSIRVGYSNLKKADWEGLGSEGYLTFAKNQSASSTTSHTAIYFGWNNSSVPKITRKTYQMELPDDLSRMVKGDFDGDGKTDLFSYQKNGAGYLFTIFENFNVDDGFSVQSPQYFKMHATTELGLFRAMDVNGNSKDELVWIYPGTSTINVFVLNPRNGDKKYLSVNADPTILDGDARVGNFDGKTRDSLFIYKSYVCDNEAYLMNSLTLTFKKAFTDLEVSGTETSHQITHNHKTGQEMVADINNNGRDELVLIDKDDFYIYVNTLAMCTTGEWTVSKSNIVIDSSVMHYDKARIGDANGDGRDDLMFASYEKANETLTMTARSWNGSQWVETKIEQLNWPNFKYYLFTLDLNTSTNSFWAIMEQTVANYYNEFIPVTDIYLYQAK